MDQTAKNALFLRLVANILEVKLELMPMAEVVASDQIRKLNAFLPFCMKECEIKLS